MEEDSLTSAFRRIGSRLRLSAIRLTGTSDDADDALQEAFFRLWKRRGSISTREQAERMLTAAVRNAGIDTLRGRIHTAADDEIPERADTDDSAERAELLAEVTRLIESRLTAEQREILYERDRYGWEFDEIAHRHGISEAHARMIVSRCRRKVRELYLQKQKQ